MNSTLRERLKAATGIAVANCESCEYLGSDSDGNYPEMAKTWPVCHRKRRMGNLRGFPFKNDMKCWEPEFWHSKFAGMIETGETEEVDQLFSKFMKAIRQCDDLNP